MKSGKDIYVLCKGESMENKIGTDILLEQFVELRNTIDLDVIGKACRKYTVSISATWDADGRVELSCYPWETVGVNDDN